MNEPCQEMPRYRSHKTVWALKIKSIEQAPADQLAVNPDGDWYLIPEEDGFGKIVVGHDYYTKHRPAAGGYYVVYADGYKSFSPSKVFEDGNTLVSELEAAKSPAKAIEKPSYFEAISVLMIQASCSAGNSAAHRDCGQHHQALLVDKTAQSCRDAIMALQKL